MSSIRFVPAATGLPQGEGAITLANDVDPIDLLPRLHKLTLIALQFPKWTDGRAYSQARLLRARYRWRGELRATGEVLVDMLPLLERTGFDAVQLAEGQDQAAAERALRFFDRGHYQGDLQQPRPLFGRRDRA
jgi:uncharacterized protein (DUF934 family)